MSIPPCAGRDGEDVVEEQRDGPVGVVPGQVGHRQEGLPHGVRPGHPLAVPAGVEQQHVLRRHEAYH